MDDLLTKNVSLKDYEKSLAHASNLSDELALAIQAAQAAGQVIREGNGRIHTIDQKSVGDLVSEVDQLADRAVCDLLEQQSAIPILSEELHPEIKADTNEFWIVDPLDGTNAFLMRVGDHYSSVLVARRQNGETELGVAYFPLTGEWFYAVRGGGAFKNGERISVAPTPARLSQCWVEMNQYGDSSQETESFSKLRRELRTSRGARLVTIGVPHAGVAARIADSHPTLAAAVHDNNPDFVKQAPWDIAAPQLILQEAGGVFLDLAGQPFDVFDVRPFVVAQSVELAHQIIALAQ